MSRKEMKISTTIEDLKQTLDKQIEEKDKVIKLYEKLIENIKVKMHEKIWLFYYLIIPQKYITLSSTCPPNNTLPPTSSPPSPLAPCSPCLRWEPTPTAWLSAAASGYLSTISVFCSGAQFNRAWSAPSSSPPRLWGKFSAINSAYSWLNRGCTKSRWSLCVLPWLRCCTCLSYPWYHSATNLCSFYKPRFLSLSRSSWRISLGSSSF